MAIFFATLHGKKRFCWNI